MICGYAPRVTAKQEAAIGATIHQIGEFVKIHCQLSLSIRRAALKW
jgi:hypothetical protein